MQERALRARARRATARPTRKGVALTPLERTIDADAAIATRTSTSRSTARARTATLTVQAPAARSRADIAGIEAAGAAWWPLRWRASSTTRSCTLRTNELDIGTWLLKTEGDADAVLAMRRDAAGAQATTGSCARRSACCAARFARLDVSSRTLFALIEPGSCFAGTLLELALAADRSYMLALPDDAGRARRSIALSRAELRRLPDGQRPERACSAASTTKRAPLDAARAAIGQPLDADAALALGLVTAAPDDIDWDDEMRIALEERASCRPMR